MKNAPILLLDEATSELDIDSEEAIRLALERLMRGRTVIAVAHRLSTLRDFDRIVVLQAGRIAEEGAPEQLLRIPGVYRDLIRREMLRLSTAAPADGFRAAPAASSTLDGMTEGFEPATSVLTVAEAGAHSRHHVSSSLAGRAETQG